MIQPPPTRSNKKATDAWLNHLLRYVKTLAVKSNQDIQVERTSAGTQIKSKKPKRMTGGGSQYIGRWL